MFFKKREINFLMKITANKPCSPDKKHITLVYGPSLLYTRPPDIHNRFGVDQYTFELGILTQL